MDVTPVEAADAALTLILIPLTDAVLMPGTIMPLAIGRPAVAAALQDAARTERHIAVVFQREPFAEVPGLDELQSIGTEARLLRYFTGRDGSHHAIVQGIGRIRIENMAENGQYSSVNVRRVAEPDASGAEIDARIHQIRERSLQILRLIDQDPLELTSTIRSINGAGALADFVTGLLDLTLAEKQEIFDAAELMPRLDLVITRLSNRERPGNGHHEPGQSQSS